MDKDKRIPLKENTELNVTNRQGGRMTYVIQQEIGRGGSCIVYSGYYVSNYGAKKPVRIKECYPFGLRILREESGNLTVDKRDQESYDRCRARMRESFEVGNELADTSGLTNSVSYAVDLYEANDTYYTVSTFLEGETLSPKLCGSLKEAVAIVKGVAETVGRIHNRGYLYLDIKPENLFVLKNVTELVVLFDFDSLIPIDEKGETERSGLLFTKDFAAPELRTGRLERIGRQTDVYGVGALLYYLIFGRIPDAADRDVNAQFDYGQSGYFRFHYRDKLLRVLSDFFHHTLAVYFEDRYENLDEAVHKLAEAEKLADLAEPFICDSYIPEQVFLVGREREEERICQWMSDDRRKCIFVIGMGGIGKSTLVQACISKNRWAFDTVLYLYYNGSLQTMIADDCQLCINTLEKMAEESSSDYFKRKLMHLSKLTAGTRTLLVIDNYDGQPGADFLAVMNVGWKIIAITRRVSRAVSKEYETVNIRGIQDREALREVFLSNLGREVEHEEEEWLDWIIDKLDGHTLTLELTARQMAKSYLTMQQAVLLVDRFGFAEMASEKVDYIKDGRLYYDQIRKIITALFSKELMSMERKVLLWILALFDMPGIKMDDFRRMTEYMTLDPVNELQEEGWIQVADRYLSLHPIVREAVLQWGWEEEYRPLILRTLKYLCREIMLRSKREECIERLSDMADGTEYCWDAGEAGECMERRKDKQIEFYLRLSESALDTLHREGILKDTEEYQRLLYHTIMNLPRDKEDFIMFRSEEFIQNAELWLGFDKETGSKAGRAVRRERGGGKESKSEWKRRYAEAVIRLCDYVVFIHCDKKEFEQAWSKMMRVKRFAGRQRSRYLKGLYYDMLTEYYDAILSGFYRPFTREDKRNLRLMLKADAKSVRCMRGSRERDAGRCLVKYLIGEATLLTRSCPEKGRKIRKIMDEARKLVWKYVSDDSETMQAYYLAQAWYYTLSEPDYGRMSDALCKAYEIAKRRECFNLDMIDFIMVPASDMLTDWGIYDLAIEGLEAAIGLCNSYPYAIPYIRKKMDIYNCLFDVYFVQEDFEQCRRVIAVIDEENEKNSWAGVANEMPKEAREMVAEKV